MVNASRSGGDTCTMARTSIDPHGFFWDHGPPHRPCKRQGPRELGQPSMADREMKVAFCLDNQDIPDVVSIAALPHAWLWRGGVRPLPHHSGESRRPPRYPQKDRDRVIGVYRPYTALYGRLASHHAHLASSAFGPYVNLYRYEDWNMMIRFAESKRLALYG